MFDEDSVSRLHWGGGHCRKNQTDDVFDFLALFSSPIEGPAMIAMGKCDEEEGIFGWLNDKNRDRKKIEPTFSIFSAMMLFTQFPPSTVLRI